MSSTKSNGLKPVSIKAPDILVEQVQAKIKKDKAKLRLMRAHSLTGLTIELWKGFIEGRFLNVK